MKNKITYTLFTQVDVSSFDDELPKYKGFWTEELFAAKNLQLREVQKNGSKYYAATIKKLALFPTQSGKLIIDPLTAVIGIREKQQRWNDALDDLEFALQSNQLSGNKQLHQALAQAYDGLDQKSLAATGSRNRGTPYLRMMGWSRSSLEMPAGDVTRFRVINTPSHGPRFLTACMP